MKKLFSILLFITASIYPQGNSSLLLMNDEGFSPLTYDTKTFALFDGDKELTTSEWADQSSNGYDITFANSPTVTNTLNTHKTVLFNGVDEWGQHQTTPTMASPITVYMVVKQITWTSNDFLFCARSTGDYQIRQRGSTPQISLINGTEFGGFTGLTLDTWKVFTAVFNGASSQMRVNLNNASSGNAGSNSTSTGFVLAAVNSGGSGFGHCEIAYVILRFGADDTETQNKFINYLIDRFGL